MFLRDDYYEKILAHAKMHGQEDACAQLRDLAERLEGRTLKDALLPVTDDPSSSSNSQSPPGTPPAQTGDSVTTGDNDVPMDGDEAIEMAIDEVIEDDSPMPCAIDISTDVHPPIDGL